MDALGEIKLLKRRGGDAEWASPTPNCGGREPGEQSSPPEERRLPSPGFQCWGEKSLQLLTVKTSRDCG